MDIVYQKNGFKREFSRFLMFKNKYYLICFEKNKYLKAKKHPSQREFLAEKTGAKIHTIRIFSGVV